MLEVNDFNAIRLSLASNAQIRSWSYGEVTKPETINYRTLKPEKDGLFCEKIFGPTKDFECHCGKYKRARYKGIVCDKCGVEVARSKVRRERMGHISLAAPVAHIWFSKGVPSRLGLLLDVPPRTLERVLYFSHYVITEVNDEARGHALELLQLEIEDEVARREGEAGGRIAVREQALEQEISEVDGRVESELALCEEELARLVDEIMSEARELEGDLRTREGEKLRAKLAFRGDTLAARGTAIGSETLVALTEAAERAVGGAEEQIASRRSDLMLRADAERQQRRDAAFTELEPLRAQVAEVREAVRKEYEPLVKWLDRLRDPVEADALTVLSESEFRDVEERFGLVFKAGMGAEAVLSILERIDLAALRDKLQHEIDTTGGQRQKKATKRLRIVESLRKSGNRPDWMVVQELPVLPPDLRPMVQLDGGRFATSDLNDLYRRVINRNNRLKRLLKLGAPEIIIRNEKRMLQEAVDSLIDNGRRGRAVSGSGNHKLKSLSDLLKGKQGRFRQNLLGKRVDYSGRSVIIVGPTLKLHECGLPKKMALELFKPFVMHALVRSGLAHNIKSAKRIVERAQPEVWDVLEEVIRERPVLLNRAPTLHRLGIQAFEPTLVEGSAIQLHPLVCFAYNADFDGDQMAVHVPLSYEAVAEARQVMLSTKNLLSPSDGEPVVAPTLDMVLGCYYMTFAPDVPADSDAAPAERPKAYTDVNEVRLAYTLQQAAIHDRIRVRIAGGELVETTVGRILFHEVVPEGMGFQDRAMDKKALRELVSRVYLEKGPEVTADVVDAIKNIGFRYATQSGLTISSSDISVPRGKERLMGESDRSIDAIEEQFQMGLVTAGEKRAAAINVWTETTAEMQKLLTDSLDPEGPLAMMSDSGAKGNIAQIRQMAGFRGLMSDPSGRIIELPIRSSFKEGLTVLEYFISTHGARKGLADTALRTADSGYLTRRMIDVAQDLIIAAEDCVSEGEPVPGIWLRERAEQGLLASLEERITGRWAASPVAHPETGEVLVESNAPIVEECARLVVEAGVEHVHVRSPLTCLARRGICRRCYGRSLATGQLVELGVAVGIIAAQSIGEPGTQLTMRTFHTGGVAGLDITSGLPRVEEIFEARVPKGQAVLSEVDGLVQVERDGDQRQIRVSRTETVSESYELPEGYTLLVSNGDVVDPEQPLAQAPDDGGEKTASTSGSRSRKAKTPARAVLAGLGGRVEFDGDGSGEEARTLRIVTEVADVREYTIAANARVRVESGAFVHAGEQLTEGALDPQAVLAILGPEAVQVYLVDEVQRVYRSQGVNINDRHIEVIVRQMMRRIRVDEPGDSDLLRSELVDRWTFDELNTRVVSEQGAPAAGVPVLLGVTKASLSTDSFLAAASFQETTRVLTDAAISGATDHLRGLKENVIIGKLIPARAQVTVDRPAPIAEMAMPESLLLPFAFDFEREAMYGGTPSIFELGEELERELVGGTPVSYVADPD
ncbi:MAG: DNA-directed RNA polymerase subunit beta' [Chloroflexi bacterium]|nr:DNA-directed RNA polymerase subunit beta' [Chloroflexota bacterium]